MAVSRKAMTEGIRTLLFWQSLSQKSKIFASSLYTREPLGAPAPVRSSVFLRRTGNCTNLGHTIPLVRKDTFSFGAYK